MNSSKLKKAIAGLVFVVAAVGLAESPAPQPTLELVASSTNLVVTEQCTVSIKLWMPPLTQAFMPDVPEASCGRRGLLSQTSTPRTRWRATRMS